MIVRARAKQEWLVVPFTTHNSNFEVRIAIKD
jgi:CheY-specific phosphatase CheX